MGNQTSKLESFAIEGGETQVSDISHTELDAWMNVPCNIAHKNAFFDNQECIAKLKLPLDATITSKPSQFDDNVFDNDKYDLVTDKAVVEKIFLTVPSYDKIKRTVDSIKGYTAVGQFNGVKFTDGYEFTDVPLHIRTHE